MVSGLAPGKAAETWMVGKSTFGRSLTGNARYPATPNSTIPIISSAVMTGRVMKISVNFIGRCRGHLPPVIQFSGCLLARALYLRGEWKAIDIREGLFAPSNFQ